MNTKTTKVISIVLLAIPSLMIVMSGVMKLIGAEELVKGMTQGGFGNYITLFGLIEVVSVALLFYKKTYKIGFLLLCCYLGGALSVELSGGKFPTAAILLTLLWIGAYLKDKTQFTVS